MLGETILVLFGAILGWAMSLYGFRVSEKVNLIDDHIKDVSKYSEELRLHWSRSFIEDAESQNREIIRIKSLHISIQSFYVTTQVLKPLIQPFQCLLPPD